MTKQKTRKSIEKEIKMLEREERKKLRLAKINESYHRKQMEYFQEEIKILEDSSK